MHGPRHNSRAVRGFTLLELLVATAVSAVVLLVINATFFSALRLHNTTRDRINEDLEVQRALSIVRQDLAGLMLPGGVLSGQLQTTTFSSGSEGIDGERVGPDIYTNSGKVDGWTPFADVQMVAYYLTTANDGTKNLVRAVTRNLLPVQDTLPEETTLLTGLASAEMLFYDGMDWTSDWDSEATSTLPGAIKFSIVMAPPAGAEQQTTTAAPIELVVPVVVSTRVSQQEQAAAAAGGS